MKYAVIVDGIFLSSFSAAKLLKRRPGEDPVFTEVSRGTYANMLALAKELNTQKDEDKA